MANTIQKVNNSLSKQNQQPKLSQYLAQESVRLGIENSIGKKKSVDFIANVLACSAASPALQDCDYRTVVSAAMMATSLELPLSPQLGYVYLVPFKDTKNNRTVATFVLGYKGYIQLAIRSGQYRKINVFALKEGELTSWNPATEDIDIQIQDYDGRENAPTIGYCARIELVNGFVKTLYWSKTKMLHHADKYSKAFNLNAVKSSEPKKSRVSYADYIEGKYNKEDAWKYSSYWYSDFDGMAMKTMLRQIISKWGIMSIQMQQAYEADSVDELPNGQGFVSFDDEDGAEANTGALDGADSADDGDAADRIFGTAE